jgi:signal transduction histidine kinase/CheY-like chemotaxis protein
MLKKLFRAFKLRFEPPMDESVRDTFAGELEYECSKLFYIVFITMFVWFAYIPGDMSLHQYPALTFWIRLGLTILSVVLCALKLLYPLRMRSAILLKTLIVYIYFASAFIAAISGDAVTAYTSGYVFVIMTALIAPFSIKFKAALTIGSLILYLLAGTWADIDFSDPQMEYVIRDLVTAVVAFIALSYLLNIIRFKAWEQRRKLKNVIAENERNLNTIFSLAGKAEASDKAKSSFLATMSHEIRTPLNAIIGIAQIQIQSGENSEECVAALEKIYGSGNSLLGIINDILDMSKIETGKLELYPVEYDIPSLINDSVQLNIVRIGTKPIDFELAADEKLPFKLYGSELRIKQILNNLLSNAIKYTDSGQVRLSVSHIAADNNEVLLKFSISDTGQGMKPEDTAQLFSEYTRFNAEANRTTEGTGLGLSITKKLVDMMDGTIEAESVFGEGSTFTFTVKQKIINGTPIGKEITENLCALNYSDNIMGERRRFVREIMPYGRVLIVDDVEINLFVAEGLFAPYKLKVETALSGFKAIEKIQNAGEPYDIVFMDHMMPKMDGIETTKRLRSSGYNGIIVALTANALVGHEEFFLQNGFDGFISKPIDVKLMNSLLNKYIRDRYPEEAKKYAAASESLVLPGMVQSDKKLMQIFRRDAENAVTVLRGFADTNDIKLFTTTAHAMKSALANIGDSEGSVKAFALEKAGLSGNISSVFADIESFIELLEAYIRACEPGDSTAADDSAVEEDTAFLSAQLALIKTACGDYDADAAYAALNELKSKQWKSHTLAAIEEIHEMLYLSSDFEKAAEMAEKFGGLLS